MAPEQACGRTVDGRADVHAAGVVLYERVAGRSPYDELDPVELMRTAVTIPMPDVRTHSPTCPSYVAEWIAKATAKDPAKRFASACEARRALAGPKVLQPELDERSGSILLRTPHRALFRGPMDSRNERALAVLRPTKGRRRVALAATVVAAEAGGGWYVSRVAFHEHAPTTVAASKPEGMAKAEPTAVLGIPANPY